MKDAASTRSKFFKIVLSLVLTILLGTALGGLIYVSRSAARKNAVQENSTHIAQNGTAGAAGSEKLSAYQTDPAVSVCADKVSSSVITIIVEMSSDSGSGTVLGSAVLYAEDDENFYAVTNAHVLENSVEEFTYTFTKTLVPIQTVGENADEDLAVVSIAKSSLPDEVSAAYTLASFGDSDALAGGDIVVAVGCPESIEYQNTVTTGVVSCPDRVVDFHTEPEAFIQTDAPINPGNSGGGLFTLDGSLVGINSNKLVLQGLEGMGFAIPISRVISIIRELAPDTLSSYIS